MSRFAKKGSLSVRGAYDPSIWRSFKVNEMDDKSSSSMRRKVYGLRFATTVGNLVTGGLVNLVFLGVSAKKRHSQWTRDQLKLNCANLALKHHAQFHMERDYMEHRLRSVLGFCEPPTTGSFGFKPMNEWGWGAFEQQHGDQLKQMVKHFHSNDQNFN